MALVTVNNIAVISGMISMPLEGVWTADLVIDQPDGSGFSAGTQVTIAAANGITLTGVVAPNLNGSFLDAVHVRILGGAGGMSKPASPRSFVQPGAFVRDIMNGLASDSGETLSATMDAGFMSTNLTAWSVIADGNVSQAMSVLIEFVAPDLNWRVLSDGTLWIGAESWPEGSSDFEVIAQNPATGTADLGVDSPWIAPGISLSGLGNVNMVEHMIEPERIRSRVWLYDDDASFKRSIAGIVHQTTAAFDYHALYRCKVVAQSSDLATVDVQPDGQRNQTLLGGLQRVPLRLAPGIKVQFTPSVASVLLGWDGGNPSLPYACLGVPGDTALKVTVAATQVEVTATTSVKVSGATAELSATGTSAVKGVAVQLGNNPVKTPVLTVGAVDFMGIPITNSPTNTGTVTSG